MVPTPTSYISNRDMNTKHSALVVIWITLMLTSCFDKPEPAVATRYMHPEGSREEQRSQALMELHQFYALSDKTDEYYEVISRANGRFILNYHPTGELLTYCLDPGSGWLGQVANVSEDQLKRMANLTLSLDSLDSFVRKDSVLKNSDPFILVKTNGNPSL